MQLIQLETFVIENPGDTEDTDILWHGKEEERNYQSMPKFRVLLSSVCTALELSKQRYD